MYISMNKPKLNESNILNNEVIHTLNSSDKRKNQRHKP